jgi:hypothetical protein
MATTNCSAATTTSQDSKYGDHEVKTINVAAAPSSTQANDGGSKDSSIIMNTSTPATCASNGSNDSNDVHDKEQLTHEQTMSGRCSKILVGDLLVPTNLCPCPCPCSQSPPIMEVIAFGVGACLFILNRSMGSAFSACVTGGMLLFHFVACCF